MEYEQTCPFIDVYQQNKEVKIKNGLCLIIKDSQFLMESVFKIQQE